ncbi:glycoside hydrolase family 13 protein [Lacticaseibacillus porcinae]|uniref:glycoside hydrolase family 13 protein n=1 Tax=Lacticaseibacillus porcinae TaxID=1123687 RepID=UPI000F79405F|nr:glycoside hydrolase family 13 protein [Lacticaseibacillus porcinae]
MKLEAISHRPQSEDCFMITANTVRLRVHAAIDDLQQVTVFYGDPYATQPESAQWQSFSKSMTKVAKGEVHDYWQADVTVPNARLQYWFIVSDHAGGRMLLGDRGFRADTQAMRQDPNNAFHLPYLHPEGQVDVPQWVTQTVWYQIFPDRFANGDVQLDPPSVRPWDPQAHPNREDFFGGDLQGVIDHLDDLAALGINGLYFCPVFKAKSNHKYDTCDYFQIDPGFGDLDLFKRLVADAHARGMHVMLDAVFNHIGYFSPQWQDVLEKGQQSPYVDWFHIHEWPLIPYRDPNQGAGQPQYETFAYESQMPKLNTENLEVQAFLLKIATYWIQVADIDAWRLDVANEVDHHFWRMLRQAVTALKPDVYLVGEVWHNAQPWLNGDEFTGVMNYPFTQQIADHFLTGASTAAQMIARLSDQLMHYRTATNTAMLNQLDSHDTPRLLTQAGGDISKMLQALAFMFIQPGAPCLYYGTEMGMFGDDDPDDRKAMDWAQLGESTWQKVHTLVQMRRQYSELLSQGILQYHLTDHGLIKVTRQTSTQQLTAWFNTTSASVAFKPTGQWQQGAAFGELSPHGFVITVE